MDARGEPIHFERGGSRWYLFLAASLAAVWTTTEGGWWKWIGLAGLMLGVVDVAWGMRNPMVTLTSRSVVIRPGLLRSARELLLSEIYSWAHTSQILAFRTHDGRRTGVPIGFLRARDREALLKKLDALELERPGPEPLDSESLARQERRTRNLILGSGLVIMAGAFAFLWWTYEVAPHEHPHPPAGEERPAD